MRRWGTGTAAIVRLLIGAAEPLTGVAIARIVGVTQPRVSQVLTQLAASEAVRIASEGYLGRRKRLFELYQQRARPVLVRPESYWYSALRTMDEQVSRVVQAADRDRTTVTVSADFGADLLGPWRHPTLTVVYTAKRLSLVAAGFVRAEGRADASLITRWTHDRTLVDPLPIWPAQISGTPMTDPVQQWWDLLDLGGEDRAEAASRLRRVILDRTLPSAS